MTDAGRFTTLRFDYIENDCQNQGMEVSYKLNYFVGVVICKVSVQKLPNHFFFGNNPIEFITTQKEACSQMKNEYGEEI